MAHDGVSGTEKVIDIKAALQHPVQRGLYSLVAHPLERGLSIDRFNETYRSMRCEDRERDFFRAALEALQVAYSVSDEDLRAIPVEGPLVTVSNHPFGGLDGVLMGALLGEVRQDFRILGNYLLQRFQEIRDLIIAVDPFGGHGRHAMNIAPLRRALRWIEGGGALISFPAGEVSHLVLKKAWVADGPWSPHVGSLVRKAKATVLPVYFEGRNSNLFQLAGLIHPVLRTAMLPREVLNKASREVRIRIGKPMPWSTLKRFEDNGGLVHYLRVATYAMQEPRPKRAKGMMASVIPFRRRREQAIIAPIDKTLLCAEVSSLAPEQRLAGIGTFGVYVAEAEQIPNLLREIGRLREVTFRQVQEGTGNALDLDRFDGDYLHLFLWNHEEEQVVGAYRMGLVPRLLEQSGERGLYTTTLFRYKTRFIERLESAIELGRSFVRPDYQKKQGCLSMLWRGLGEFVARHPQYEVFFGPVSISQGYHSVSKDLMIRFLYERRFNSDLARYVTPRNPHRLCRVAGVSGLDREVVTRSLACVEDVSAVISEIERDGKGIPVLLRHYLKLDATLISFNEDRAFGNVVDGLIWVDLARADRRLLKRYMGESAFEAYASYHGWDIPEKCRTAKG